MFNVDQTMLIKAANRTIYAWNMMPDLMEPVQIDQVGFMVNHGIHGEFCVLVVLYTDSYY